MRKWDNSRGIPGLPWSFSRDSYTWLLIQKEERGWFCSSRLKKLISEVEGGSDTRKLGWKPADEADQLIGEIARTRRRKSEQEVFGNLCLMIHPLGTIFLATRGNGVPRGRDRFRSSQRREVLKSEKGGNEEFDSRWRTYATNSAKKEQGKIKERVRCNTLSTLLNQSILNISRYHPSIGSLEETSEKRIFRNASTRIAKIEEENTCAPQPMPRILSLPMRVVTLVTAPKRANCRPGGGSRHYRPCTLGKVSRTPPTPAGLGNGKESYKSLKISCV
ncbi:hypothetical protein WN51_03055 [Melipona quadrifasciata]|uniref:Uncharacterized protein n=1 Tax=Melipona quadrifasciata TaxID=166423 RepID=A0A0M8ZVD7_9HYME|nr:hypothetical protein WN51_03055 [Melipona quadrifasciata]